MTLTLEHNTSRSRVKGYLTGNHEMTYEKCREEKGVIFNAAATRVQDVCILLTLLMKTNVSLDVSICVAIVST